MHNTILAFFDLKRTNLWQKIANTANKHYVLKKLSDTIISFWMAALFFIKHFKKLS
jgi:hypothetical protein